MTLNKYQITWAIIRPLTGVIPKKDYKRLFPFVFTWDNTYGLAHFRNKDSAMEKIKSLKLSKPYEVFFITDAQFGNARETSVRNPLAKYYRAATQKQLSEAFIIQPTTI